MANVKWTEFPAASTISGSDLIPIVQSGTNKKATGTIFATYIGTLFVSLSAEQTIAGVKTFSSQLASSVATGTAPFSIASTTKVTNLNADLLDGYTSADFQLALTNPITGTGTTNYLPKFTGTSALGNSLIYDNGTNVGIGTASPGDKLDIYSSANSQQGLKITNPNAGTSAIAVTKYSNGTYTHLFGILGTNYTTYGVLQANEAFMYSAAQSMSFGADGDSSIKFGTGTGVTERMRITSAGNVGIATTSPSNLLSVSNNNLAVISLDWAGDNNAKSKWSANHSTGEVQFYNYTNYFPTFYANGSEKMRITTAGNVGIGTTSPNRALTIVGGFSEQIALTSTNTKCGIALNPSDTTFSPYIGATANDVIIETFGNERMRVTTGGNVLIGTTTDAGYKLDVNGTARVSGAATFSSSVSIGTSSGSYRLNVLAPFTSGLGGAYIEAGEYDKSVLVLNHTNGSVSANLLDVQKSGSSVFKIASTGVATFNSGTANQNTKIFGNKVGMSRTSDGAEVVYFSKNTDLGAEGTANINGYNGIQFRTQGAESVKVTIKENGNLLVNKTTDVGYKLDVFGTTRLDPQGGEYGLVVGRASGMVNIKAGSDDGGYLLMDSAGEGGMVGLNWYSSENVILVNGGGQVGIGTSTPDASAKVQIDSNTQGFLVPRMLESEINSISSPAAGLLVYNTNQNHMCMYDGSVWKKFSMSNM